jgi:hypothetical protein
MPIQFLNADLEITSSEDLNPIRAGFARYGDRFHELYYGEIDDDCYLATFEINPEAEHSEEEEYRDFTAQERIHAFCDSIDELHGAARDIWFRAKSRVIDLGYESDTLCEAFHDRLSVDTLRRLELLGIELVLTIYPQTRKEAQQAAPSNGG